MDQATKNVVEFPSESEEDVLTVILRDGAREMLGRAIQAEVAEYLEPRQELRDAAGRRQVVRNGYLPERTIQTPLGEVPVKQPRVRDRRAEPEREKFESSISRVSAPATSATPCRLCWAPRLAGCRRRRSPV